MKIGTLSEKVLYSQWIFETLIKKIPKKTANFKSDFNSAFEIITSLQEILACCKIPVADVFPSLLNSLNKASSKVLNDNEQDLLIFMHAAARMQNVFDLIKAADFKHSNMQLLCSKAKRYEIKKRYLRLLNQFKYLTDNIKKVDITEVLAALTKPGNLDTKIKEIEQTYNGFKCYVAHACRQENRISEDILHVEEKISLFDKLDTELQHCIGQNVCDEKIPEHFSVMSGMCELRERKDALILEFRNYLVRIGHHVIKDVPVIKKKLLEFNKEIQILFRDYNKYKVKLQFLNPSELTMFKNMFKDIEAIILADVKAYKAKRTVGMLTMKCLGITETEELQRKSEEGLKEVEKSVDETMEFLRSLDETVISKNFSAMRYLCELIHEKEQIISSFEKLLFAMHKLNVEDDKAIMDHLAEIKCYAENLNQKYETLGMQLMLFSDIMAMVCKENETDQYPTEDELKEGSTISVSELFGSTEDVKKLHYSLDAAIKDKWFPAKRNLSDILIEKQRMIQAFKNLLERMPEINLENTLDIIVTIRHLINNAENTLRKYQSLRIQLIWIASSSVFDVNI